MKWAFVTPRKAAAKHSLNFFIHGNSLDGVSFWENHNLANVLRLIDFCDKTRSFEEKDEFIA